jgi:hypothetical protein
VDLSQSRFHKIHASPPWKLAESKKFLGQFNYVNTLTGDSIPAPPPEVVVHSGSVATNVIASETGEVGNGGDISSEWHNGQKALASVEVGAPRPLNSPSVGQSGDLGVSSNAEGDQCLAGGQSPCTFASSSSSQAVQRQETAIASRAALLAACGRGAEFEPTAVPSLSGASAAPQDQAPSPSFSCSAVRQILGGHSGGQSVQFLPTPQVLHSEYFANGGRTIHMVVLSDGGLFISAVVMPSAEMCLQGVYNTV